MAFVLATVVAFGCDSDDPDSDSVPPAAVHDLTVTAMGDSGVLLHWTAPGDDENRGQAASYDLRRASQLPTDNSFDLATPIAISGPPGPAGSPDSAMVDGLPGGQRYYFALRTSDETGNSSDLSNIDSLDVPGIPEIIHAWKVRADGSGDVPTIQAAIDTAVDGDTVLIGPGVYDGLLTIDGKELTLIGEGGAEKVTLTETLVTAPSILTVTLPAGKRVVIEGLRFHKGQSRTSPGGALSMYGPGDLALRRCRFEDNETQSEASIYVITWGAALYVQSARELLIEDCLFTGNRAIAGLPRHSDPFGGAVMATCQTARVIRSVFRKNVVYGTECGARGGAIYFKGTSLQVEECEFTENSAGAGGAIASEGSMTLVRSRFIRNRGSGSPARCGAGVGPTVSHDGRASLDACVFLENDNAGNVVRLDGTGGITMRDCTVAFNKVTGGGGYPLPVACVWIEPPAGTQVEFVRNLVASNLGTGIRHNLVDLSGVACNNIWGNSSGSDFGAGTDFRGINGNIGLDPKFCHPSLKRTEVTSDSPCLPGNAGHPDGCGVIGTVAAGCDTPSASPSWRGWR